MDRLAYLIKTHAPGLFVIIERLARLVVTLRYRRRVHAAKQDALTTGTVQGQQATMRVLTVDDAPQLHTFLNNTSADWLQYFQPHPFDEKHLKRILASSAFLTHGLFIDERLQAYGLLKLTPTGSAFIGLLVDPKMTGLGLGTFIVDHLYWQASRLRLRARSTISTSNPASLKSHQAVAQYRVVAELPNNYIMIEFPNVPRPRPTLQLP